MTLDNCIWLGIDVGSAQKKVCSFCLIESDGAGEVVVSFEQGPARAPYPKTNSCRGLIGERGQTGASLEAIAARTCTHDGASRRLRETFPSDIYKRANGYTGKDGVAGILSDEARGALRALVVPAWQGAGEGRGRQPTTPTVRRLEAIRKALRDDLETCIDELLDMRRRPGRYGDL